MESFSPLIALIAPENSGLKEFLKEKGLSLLLHYPGGPFLPANQEELEVAYRRELKQQHGITFNGLLTITNMLTGRFKDSLIKNGDLNNTLEHCFGCTARADSSCNRSLEKVLND